MYTWDPLRLSPDLGLTVSFGTAAYGLQWARVTDNRSGDHEERRLNHLGLTCFLLGPYEGARGVFEAPEPSASRRTGGGWFSPAGAVDCPTRRCPIRKALPVLVVLLAASLPTWYLLVRSVTMLENTLVTNGNWVHHRQRRPNTYTYHNSITSLIGGRLHLNLYGAFNDVLYREAVAPAAVAFEFQVPGDAGYFYAIFDRGEDGYKALRLGNAAGIANGYFEVALDGEFRRKVPLALPPIAARTWYAVRLAFHEGRIALQLDGTEVADIEARVCPEQRFGFIGSSRQVLVDDVVVTGPSGEVLVDESFSQIRFRPGVLPLAWLAALAFGALVFGLARVATSTRNALFAVAMLHLTLWAAAGLTLWLWPEGLEDSAYKLDIDEQRRAFNEWARMDAYIEFNRPVEGREPPLPGSSESFLGAREIAAMMNPGADGKYPDPFAPQTIEGALRAYTPRADDGARRLLFIGTSQTFGEGAPSRAATFVSRLEARLDRGDGGAAYECINGGIKDSDSTNQLAYYEQYWLQLRPDVTLINLGNNDLEREVTDQRFAANLTRFIRINRSRGIATVLLLEPNASEVFPQDHRLHRVIRAVAREQGVPLIDLHGRLRERSDDGILWVDHVHLSGYGHRLVAALLHEALGPLLQQPAREESDE